MTIGGGITNTANSKWNWKSVQAKASILGSLEKIERLLIKYDKVHAQTVISIIRKIEEDDGDLENILNSATIWGGAGSLCDLLLDAESVDFSPNEVKKDTYEFWWCLLSISRAMDIETINGLAAKDTSALLREWIDEKVLDD